MKPLPWSHSSLSDFVNCPRSFHRKRIVKDVREEETEALRWGNLVHKIFEDRIRFGKPLPEDLKSHEGYLARLAGAPGEKSTERKIALSRAMVPCGFFDKEVWFRGVIDLSIINGTHALIVDYKTGKPHSKFEQLQLFAIYIFLENPAIETIEARYYWTQTYSATSDRYTREFMGDLWAPFLPNLKQYKEAFRTDTWQPRQSGLCGWCPVKDCEFWRPRRK